MKFLPSLKRKRHSEYRVHTLKDNHNLTPGQHARCVAMAKHIQRLYDEAPAYAARKGLDPAIALPGNEWATIIPTGGLKFRTTYNDINYLRFNSPFIGFHLPILDRVDRRRFPNDGGEEFLAQLRSAGIPDDIAEVHAKLDGETDLMALSLRLAETPCSPLYKRHISPDRELSALVAGG